VVLSRRAAGLSLAGRLPRRQPLFGVAMAFVALVVTDKRVLTRGKVRGLPDCGAFLRWRPCWGLRYLGAMR
jgi:hypothetical protein